MPVLMSSLITLNSKEQSAVVGQEILKDLLLQALASVCETAYQYVKERDMLGNVIYAQTLRQDIPSFTYPFGSFHKTT